MLKSDNYNNRLVAQHLATPLGNPQAFDFENNPYLGYQQQIPYAGTQRPVAQAIPSYPDYAQPNLNR